MTKISIIHPTVRPQMALDRYVEWIDCAKYPDRVQYIFGYDKGNKQCEELLSEHTHVAPEYRLGCVNKLNAGAKIASGSILIAGSDDVHPCNEWDALIEEAIGDPTNPVVLACEDGVATKIRPELLHCFVVTYEWYNKRGYCLHPSFNHVFADDFFTAQAVAENCIVKAPHILLEHKNAFFGKANIDYHYLLANQQSEYQNGATIFEDILKEYGLKRNTESILC